MKIEFLTDDSELFLCDRYKISEIESTEEILQLRRKFSDENPGFNFLLTIDDVNQAAYTSLHARLRHDIDRLDGHDLRQLPKRCFEDGEHIGYLQTKEEFRIRKANFFAYPAVSIDTIFNKNLSLSSESGEEFLKANRDLMSVCDASLYCLKVPVENHHELICAFPNGYFAHDLNPFENLVVAKHLEERYGYCLIGIGASYLAFERSGMLRGKRLDDLHTWLMKIYWTEYGPFEEVFFSAFLREILATQKILVFRYRE